MPDSNYSMDISVQELVRGSFLEWIVALKSDLSRALDWKEREKLFISFLGCLLYMDSVADLNATLDKAERLTRELIDLYGDWRRNKLTSKICHPEVGKEQVLLKELNTLLESINQYLTGGDDSG